ncbi:hypothetical protein PQR08_38655, partial [Caballeronia jiangsuensis]
ELRERIFTLHSGGEIRGSGDRKELPALFKQWDRRMSRNAKAKKDGELLNGFLLPFVDHRSTTSMQG